MWLRGGHHHNIPGMFVCVPPLVSVLSVAERALVLIRLSVCANLLSYNHATPLYRTVACHIMSYHVVYDILPYHIIVWQESLRHDVFLFDANIETTKHNMLPALLVAYSNIEIRVRDSLQALISYHVLPYHISEPPQRVVTGRVVSSDPKFAPHIKQHVWIVACQHCHSACEGETQISTNYSSTNYLFWSIQTSLLGSEADNTTIYQL